MASKASEQRNVSKAETNNVADGSSVNDSCSFVESSLSKHATENKLLFYETLCKTNNSNLKKQYLILMNKLETGKSSIIEVFNHVSNLLVDEPKLIDLFAVLILTEQEACTVGKLGKWLYYQAATKFFNSCKEVVRTEKLFKVLKTIPDLSLCDDDDKNVAF
ncbi:uncharacterized protein LOC105847120 [Hydra vulgaris]|uniref:uncharacterized protein LOC105847120 n=1 Tax=Hydra vulgaris TaxID=6087 RepID=UPI000640C5E7|nr:uncharacterized protein LOC105847120 [Hydra vulgaris]